MPVGSKVAEVFPSACVDGPANDSIRSNQPNVVYGATALDHDGLAMDSSIVERGGRQQASWGSPCIHNCLVLSHISIVT